jgi:hypothetical protein
MPHCQVFDTSPRGLVPQRFLRALGPAAKKLFRSGKPHFSACTLQPRRGQTPGLPPDGFSPMRQRWWKKHTSDQMRPETRSDLCIFRLSRSEINHFFDAAAIPEIKTLCLMGFRKFGRVFLTAAMLKKKNRPRGGTRPSNEEFTLLLGQTGLAFSCARFWTRG